MKDLTLVKMIQDSLKASDFEVLPSYRPRQGFLVDLMATRSGLVLLIDVKQDLSLFVEDIARLAGTSMYLEKTIVPLAIKKFFVVPAGTSVSPDVRNLASDYDIKIISLSPGTSPDEILLRFDETESLRPLSGTPLDPLDEVQKTIASSGDPIMFSLLQNAIGWYKSGGKELVRKKLERQLAELPNPGGERVHV